MSKMEKKNQKNAKNRPSFLPSPVPPLNKGTLNYGTFRGAFRGTGNVRSVAAISCHTPKLYLYVSVPLFLPRPKVVLILAPTLFSPIWHQCK